MQAVNKSEEQLITGQQICRSFFPPQHCALQCTVHCIAMHCALQCSLTLHCSSKKCIAMHLTIAIAQCTIVLQSNSINIVHCNAVHINTALQLKEVHCNAQCTIVIAHCTIVLQSSSINIVHCFVIQILSLHCITRCGWLNVFIHNHHNP